MPRTGFRSSVAHRLARGAKAYDVDFSGLISLSGDGLVSLRLRPELDANNIRVFTVPDEVTVPDPGGIYKGFSLPIWSDDNQELFFRQSVPFRWDGASDLIAAVTVALSAANTDKKFQLQLAWEHFAKDAVVPASANEVPSGDKATGTAAIYQTFTVQFTIQYDIDGAGNEIKAGEVLSARLRRVDADDIVNEITGNVIILDWYVEYQRNKLGPVS